MRGADSYRTAFWPTLQESRFHLHRVNLEYLFPVHLKYEFASVLKTHLSAALSGTYEEMKGHVASALGVIYANLCSEERWKQQVVWLQYGSACLNMLLTHKCIIELFAEWEKDEALQLGARKNLKQNAYLLHDYGLLDEGKVVDADDYEEMDGRNIYIKEGV